MEEKVSAYRRANADSIVRNEALRAEELRRRVAEAEEGAGQAGLSGTAAAFAEGTDAEPHQGMEYTVALPEAAAAALATCVRVCCAGGGLAGENSCAAMGEHLMRGHDLQLLPRCAGCWAFHMTRHVLP